MAFNACANSAESASAAMGVTPVSAAAPAAVVAAISAPMADSVSDDELTAAGITPNPLVIAPPKCLHPNGSANKFSEFKALVAHCRVSSSYSGLPTRIPSMSPSVVTNKPRPGANC